MKYINVFIGSSFVLMKERRAICDSIRRLNDKCLPDGVRLKLRIWEDFNIGFSGKHKQQEYIDEMVLPSDVCIFLFSHRVGKYTRMELEAKLKQNRDAVSCFRLPLNGRYADEVGEELKALSCGYADVPDRNALCGIIEELLSGNITRQKNTESKSEGIDTLYFYTTIPDDLSKIRTGIGTAFIDLDDATMDEWGLHCQLHPQRQMALLDKTDHYIPIFKSCVSDDDLQELKTGLEKTVDESQRLRRTTVFDMGNIGKAERKVQNLLDKYGIFTDKIRELDSLKWKVEKWIRAERKKLLSATSSRLGVVDGQIAVNGRKVVPLHAIDESQSVSAAFAALSKSEKDVSDAIAANENDRTIDLLVNEQNKNKSILALTLEKSLNDWTSSVEIYDKDAKAAFDECLQMEKQVGAIVAKPVVDDVTGLKLLMREWERKEQQLVDDKQLPPLRLLATQLYAVGVYDTYISEGVAQPAEEDGLYERIVANADEYAIMDVSVERMRMNLANMYSRLEKYKEAKSLYRKAIENLQEQRDDSSIVARSVTYVFMQLFQLEQQHGTKDGIGCVLAEFEKHVNSLDISNEKSLVDQCMYVTAVLMAIDIEDDSKAGVVEWAESLFGEAEGKLHLVVDDYEYDDVFVFLPNMIARYYIDHFGQTGKEESTRWLSRAEALLKTAIGNAVKMTTADYGRSLFLQGELYDQLGFLYARIPAFYEATFKAYGLSVGIKKRLFAMNGEKSYETAIAHVLVNYAAAELAVVENADRLSIACDLKIAPLSHVQEALDIYSRHTNVAEAELGYYEALQLRGTIYHQMFKLKPQAVTLYNKAMKDLFLCWCWNKDHPDNSYRMVFIQYSGEILREYNFITPEEFELVKADCENRI